MPVTLELSVSISYSYLITNKIIIIIYIIILCRWDRYLYKYKYNNVDNNKYKYNNVGKMWDIYMNINTKFIRQLTCWILCVLQKERLSREYAEARTHHKWTDDNDQRHEQGDERNNTTQRTQVKHVSQLGISQQILIQLKRKEEKKKQIIPIGSKVSLYLCHLIFFIR